jgi:hypothetical protein
VEFRLASPSGSVSGWALLAGSGLRLVSAILSAEV